MKIWYCVKCGDYHFSEPKTTKDENGSLHECTLCKTMSIVPVHELAQDFPTDEKYVTLESFVAKTKREFKNMTFDDPRPQCRPLNYLIESLNRTKHFIHIVTESIDGFFIGMLSTKFYESDIEIHIIVWHPQKMYSDFKRLMKHSTFIKGYEKSYYPITRGILIETMSEAHQKLIILDGSIAFYGSANATLDGWSRDGELIKFTTDRNEIQKLNHNYFSKFVVKKLNSFPKKEN